MITTTIELPEKSGQAILKSAYKLVQSIPTASEGIANGFVGKLML